MSSNGVRQHVHRIYVEPEGQGKAELGKRTNGQRRDPKKTAKKEASDKDISGLAVWWGDRSAATRLYLCEGIETGQAIANSLKTKITERDSVVAAAISTSGVQALHPPDTIAEVVVAADRDEAPNQQGNVSRAGMRAARVFAFRHHERIKVKIALPDSPDSSYDFLDLFRDEGSTAVAECLARAETFQPTQEETDDNLEKRKIAEIIERVSQFYPLPDIEGIWLEYRRSERDGKVKLYQVIDWDKDPETGKLTATQWRPVSSPFSVSHRIRCIDRQDAYGLRVYVEDMNGRPRAIDFQRAKLAKMGGASRRQGHPWILPGCRQQIQTYLVENERRITQCGGVENSTLAFSNRFPPTTSRAGRRSIEPHRRRVTAKESDRFEEPCNTGKNPADPNTKV